MSDFNVYTNIKKFTESMSLAALRQVPFATAQALTQLAREIVPQEQASERINLDRPRPFTQNAIRALAAARDRPIARVVMMDKTAEYMEPYEFGGLNRLNGKALLKPIAQMSELDKYGNLPRNRLAQLKARSDVFVGTVKTKAGPINGVWQRTTEEGGKATLKLTKNGTIRIRRTAKGLNTSGRLKLLIKFTNAHPARQRIHWFDTAKSVIDKRFAKVFGAALAKALATSKA